MAFDSQQFSRCGRRFKRGFFPAVMLIVSLFLPACEAAEATCKIVLIAGEKSHGPVGNGIHDYPWSVKLLKVMIDNSNVADQVRVEYHLNGWPEDPTTLDSADTILVVSDGRDGDKYEEAPHFSSQEHRDLIAKQIQRGCGFATFHFSTFAPDEFAEDILEWSGGYFDWETDGKRQWYSTIQTADADIQISSPEHPISRGLQPFKMKEEFYFNLRFREGDDSLIPILSVPPLPGRDPDGRIVAWAKQRADGGRGFGTTCGHFYDNWKQTDFRRMMLNALVWTAGGEVPAGGVTSRYFTHEEVTRALNGRTGTERAVLDDRPIRALILSGAHHPGHPWKVTTPVIQSVLERDPRLQVDVSERIEDLGTDRIKDYDLLVLNYCNWKLPGLSEQAKTGFIKYLENGGGLIMIHFANGAFNASLPGAADSDWPEYRKICRRVWNHTPGRSGHDAYGKFVVDIAPEKHPITAGMEAFPTTDELYFRQQGTEPITLLATAHSKVTGQHEPMAFVYDYQKARVFQTVLGHSVDSIRADGTAELIRRAAAWVAHRNQVPPVSTVDPEENSKGIPLITGRFGSGLDATRGGIFIDGKKEYREAPFTVECWAKLANKQSYNILVANEAKSSATHWEIFSMTGNGFLTAYLPGQEPDLVRSNVNICDHQWHHLAMTYEPQLVRMFVDGQQVAEQALQSRGGVSHSGKLAIGRLVSQTLGCSGIIDEVRISKGIRTIEASLDKPFETDEQTLGLWHFDALNSAGAVPDASQQKNPAQAALSAIPEANVNPDKIAGHWGEEAVGFRWTEQDSVDNRWNQTQIGPFLASIIPLPEQPPVAKGLSIRIGDKQTGAVCYDTESMELRAAWTGAFLNFSPDRFGLIQSPRIAGDILFTSRPSPARGNVDLQYRGLALHHNRVALSYRIGQTEITESPWLETLGQMQVLTRTVEVEPTQHTQALPILNGSSDAELISVSGVNLSLFKSDKQITAVAIVGDDSGKLEIRNGISVILPIGSSQEVQRFKILIWSGPPVQLADFAVMVKSSSAPQTLTQLKEPGPARWTRKITTQGETGKGPGPYVLDTLKLPFNNPYHSLMFLSGHDFFSNGDIACCTVHGDVWRVSGVDDTLENLRWKRYATGLFQPLGLKIVKDQVYVLGRDQITRLHDGNGDHEADFYECFHNRYVTSPGGHDYVACLETDSQGNFYFVHATLGVVRVLKDGSHYEVVASGLRNPNGMSVGPDDTITVAPQEGNWTPASAIFEVEPGDYFGYGGPKPTSERPLGYNPPLCWIPRLVDNSTGGQVWVTSDRWGPLQGQLLNLSFGKCRMMLVLREEVDGQPQGGTVEFPLDFDSGVMRGRFSERDGQLYVSGLRGWVSSAVQDGCLQRVRYTGAPVDMPVSVKTMKNGLALTYSSPLDPESANDPENFRIQQWNYRYSASYGSPEYRLTEPLEEGRDQVEVQSATLLEDGQTVFLEIDPLLPVMQMSIEETLQSAGGTPIRQALSYTIHRVGQEVVDASRLNQQQSTNRLAAEIEEHLEPGLKIRYEQGQKSDSRANRMAALFVPQGTSPSSTLAPGAFSATGEGYLQVPLKGNYQFHLEGFGKAELQIDGKTVLRGEDDLARVLPVPVTLDRGHHRLAFRYSSPDSEDASIRVMWRGENFPDEPIPPGLLFHDGRDQVLEINQQFRQGRELYATYHCARCHVSESHQMNPSPMLEMNSTPPDLREVASRLNPEWIFQWMLNPAAFRTHTRMPSILIDDETQSSRQQAADIVAWLAQNSTSLPVDSSLADDALIARGEQIYLQQGCFSCHRLTPPDQTDSQERISLYFVSSKFHAKSLSRFLRNPQAHAPWNRMPNFQFSEEAANAVAAFLKSNPQGTLETPAEFAQADPARGQAAFLARGCANCHSTSTQSKSKQSVLQVTRQKSVFGSTTHPGCLSQSSSVNSNVPRFAFGEAEQAALTHFLETGKASLQFDSTAETSQRLFVSLRCGACHARDDQSSPRAALYFEEFDTGFLPEPVPSLTWCGEKLRSDWIAAFLKGEIHEKPRSTLKARMPAFPAYADAMATGLAAEHGLPSGSFPHHFDPALAAIGQELSLKNTGLDCRQCHGVGSQQPLGDGATQIAVGINFTHIRDRIRPEFYERFVLDPPRYEINTKMPKLAMDGQTTKIKQYFDGDARRQFNALWNFIQSIDEPPSP